MTDVRPQTLTHQGTVEAGGFLFDTDLLGGSEARRRTLAVWTPGTQVFRVSAGLLVRLPVPQTVVCARSPGLPLVRQGNLLTSAPLTEAECEALAIPSDGVVLVRAGLAEAYSLTPDTLLDPATWLAVTDWEIVEETKPLGSTATAPLRLAETVPFDPRRQLANVPPVAPELVTLLRSLQMMSEENARSRSEGRGLSSLIGMLTLPLALLARMIRPVDLGGGGTGKNFGRDGSAISTGMAPAIQTAARNPWADGLQRLAARLLVLTKMGSLVGRRQAQYIERMMKMFEQGQLQEALRHAIPLGSDGQNDQRLPPALGLPTVRPNLDLHPQTGRSGGTIGLPPDLLETLRSLYRDAFTRLEREGKIEEAAFVLAELLHESEEAVAFLERHKRLQLAAEMAEGRGLPSGLVVRQWWIAGERDRAQQIARRTGAFADAVLRLERTDREQGQVLRLAWAAALARAGQYAAAVETAWPVTEARSRTLEWQERAIALGGTAGARMLARRLALLPNSFEDIHGRVLALLDERDAAQSSARAAFAEALMKEAASPGALVFARAAIRSVIRDIGNGLGPMTLPTLKRLVQFSGDGPLRTDQPDLPPWVSLTTRARPLEVSWEPGDTGGLSVLDAAFLSDGRLLVALGEVGARMLARDGRTIAHFDQPAHHLVVADSGDRAIALAPRGSVYRLSRLDLMGRRAEDWCEAELKAWAPDYDGSLWFVAAGRDFTAVDALERRFSSLWRTPDVPGTITRIARTSGFCSFLLHSQGDTDEWGRPAKAWERWNRWIFGLPSLALRDRTEVSVPQGALLDLHRAISPQGHVADLFMRLPAEAVGVIPLHSKSLTGPLVLEIYSRNVDGIDFGMGERLRQSILSDFWLVAMTENHSEVIVRLIDMNKRQTRAILRFGGSSRVSVRLTLSALTLADDLGRVIALDLETGQVLRDLRLGAA
jgi:hypothetical protein